MVRHPGHHGRRITNLKARITEAFATIIEDMLDEHVERN